MSNYRNISYLLLFISDAVLLYVSLLITLFLRYGAIPSTDLLEVHLTAFTLLFIAWLFVFFVAGLYDKQTLLFPETLWQRILKTQLTNSFLAVLFFYLVPIFNIAPKTNLFIFLAISFGLITLWRYWVSNFLAKRRPVKAVLIASGAEAEQINERVNESAYGISITSHIRPNEIADDDLHDLAREIITRDKASLVILDTKSKVVKASLSKLYNFLYSDIYFTTVDALHETIFERISINRLRHEWFIENIRRTPHVAYDSLKRMMDVGVSGILYIISLPLYPFISLAIWLDDPGSIFYQQKRIGQFGKEIEITKFRSMTMSSEDKRVTKVGWFLRKTRIDELPQLYNVLEGKLSLIGPRPETPSLVNFYEKEISYYQARHLIKPGISGWAQLRHKNPPKFEAQIQATKEKLSYDLYYVKNRSLLLDIKIGLWTLRVLASRSGT